VADSGSRIAYGLEFIRGYRRSRVFEAFEPRAEGNSIVFRFAFARPKQSCEAKDSEEAENNYYRALPFHETNLAGCCQIRKVNVIAVFIAVGARVARGGARRLVVTFRCPDFQNGIMLPHHG